MDIYHDIKPKTLNLDLCAELGKEAAAAFLKENISLNESIIKIAKLHSLSSEAVCRVVIDANKQVYAVKHASMEGEKYVDFDVADPKAVLAGLQAGAPAQQEKKASSDYDEVPAFRQRSPWEKNTPMSKLASFEKIANVDGGACQTLLEAQLKKQALIKEGFQLEMEAKDILSKQAVLEHEIHLNEIELIKEAQSLLIETPFRERNSALDSLVKVASCACPKSPHIAANLIQKIAKCAVHAGLVAQTKLADAAPGHLISDVVRDNARVVNGDHPLFKRIRTISDQYHSYDAYTDAFCVVRTKLDGLKERICLL